SWECHKLWVAMSVTITSLLCLYALVPTFLGIAASNFEELMIYFLRFWHPFFVVICFVDSYVSNRYQVSGLQIMLEYVITLLIIGSVLLVRLHHKMRLHLRHR
ncbi:MAG: hypothetical protein M3347_18015, partial [Armatimonadota bacterium]|nr:hypothetical protein [Armatimonadota bacterium]